MSKDFRIENGQITAFISPHGAMTTAAFDLGDKKINPFYSHPWTEEEEDDSLLKYLKGDFFCLPFGAAPGEGVFDDSWVAGGVKSSRKAYAHGYSSNGVWSLDNQDASGIQLSLDYEGDGDIEKVTRKIDLDGNWLTFTDTAVIKNAVRLPVGIHPIFRLSEKPGMMKLHLPACQDVRTYPIDTDKTSVFANGAVCHDASEVPLRAGGTMDATSLPLDVKTEELLLLTNVKEGRAELDNLEEGYRVILEWDASAYRNLLLWMSNCGRDFAPWNGRNLCLGLEPITSAFDLGEEICTADNPISKDGVTTAASLEKGTAVFRHRITVEAL